MRIFMSGEGGWSGKVNFVDHFNVLVGYDTGQCCCEWADWFLSHKVQDKPRRKLAKINWEGKDAELNHYRFDPLFFHEIENPDEYDFGGMVVFRLTAVGMKDLYLHLFNCHNGYYGHGFTVQMGGQKVKSGCL